MKLCGGCWDKLREAIKERGLWKYVSEHRYEANAKIKAQLEGKPESETFDPLLEANLSICNNAIQVGGLAMMQPPKEGEQEICPICTLKVPEWIGYAADGMKKEAERIYKSE